MPTGIDGLYTYHRGPRVLRGRQKARAKKQAVRGARAAKARRLTWGKRGRP